MSTPFSIKESLLFGWREFKTDPWFYAGVSITLSVFTVVINILTGGGHGGGAVLGFLISLLASTVVTIAYARLALSAEAGNHVSWEGLWASEFYFSMLGASILQTVIIMIGFILLIIPGIIASLLLFFTQICLVDKKLDPVAALKESYRLTRPHLWKLFQLLLAIILFNVLGFLALVVGLFVTMPVSLIAVAHVYRTLANAQEPVVVPNETTLPQ